MKPAIPHVEDAAAANFPLVTRQDSRLTFYDAALRAVAQAKRFDDVKDWTDKAAAVREYARRAGDRALEIDACEIRIRADRRRGELLKELRDKGLLKQGRKAAIGRSETTNYVSLEQLDTSKDESSRAQKLAGYDGNSFERLVSRWRQHQEQEAARVTLDVLKVPPSPAGARSIMASRAEPDDSLDYFPTPPWATRALMHEVLPAAGLTGKRLGSLWEPACGEGHMAEVLSECAERVFASDVFDYGYGKVCDFLNQDAVPFGIKNHGVDWIVTNPPFGDAAIEFVERSLGIAKVGFAGFFRSQWAVEGLERYERIFRDRPPTLTAFFVERVNLCKGRWEPEGSTATAYCWLVWLKGALPRPTFWIPPGQREALTRVDDAQRFTKHPVEKRAEQQKPKPKAKSQEPDSIETEFDRCSGCRPDVLILPARAEDDALEIPFFLKRETPPAGALASREPLET